MTDITITNQSSEVFTFQDGDVTTIQSSVNSSPNIDPMPGSKPAQAILFDFDGSSKRIIITGNIKLAGSTRVAGKSITTILHQKRWLEALINGSQSSAKLFTSNYESYTFSSSDPLPSSFATSPQTTTKVVIRSVTFTENVGNPNQLPYRIEFGIGGS